MRQVPSLRIYHGGFVRRTTAWRSREKIKTSCCSRPNLLAVSLPSPHFITLYAQPKPPCRYAKRASWVQKAWVAPTLVSLLRERENSSFSLAERHPGSLSIPRGRAQCRETPCPVNVTQVEFRHTLLSVPAPIGHARSSTELCIVRDISPYQFLINLSGNKLHFKVTISQHYNNSNSLRKNISGRDNENHRGCEFHSFQKIYICSITTLKYDSIYIPSWIWWLTWSVQQ